MHFFFKLINHVYIDVSENIKKFWTLETDTSNQRFHPPLQRVQARAEECDILTSDDRKFQISTKRASNTQQPFETSAKRLNKSNHFSLVLVPDRQWTRANIREGSIRSSAVPFELGNRKVLKTTRTREKREWCVKRPPNWC